MNIFIWQEFDISHLNLIKKARNTFNSQNQVYVREYKWIPEIILNIFGCIFKRFLQIFKFRFRIIYNMEYEFVFLLYSMFQIYGSIFIHC